jgi:hypothetical protein
MTGRQGDFAERFSNTLTGVLVRDVRSPRVDQDPARCEDHVDRSDDRMR